MENVSFAGNSYIISYYISYNRLSLYRKLGNLQLFFAFLGSFIYKKMCIRDRYSTATPVRGFWNAEIIAMSIFEYDKEEEEQKLQATYEKIGEKRGEKQGELKRQKA